VRNRVGKNVYCAESCASLKFKSKDKSLHKKNDSVLADITKHILYLCLLLPTVFITTYKTLVVGTYSIS